jgi:hypothetical protein
MKMLWCWRCQKDMPMLDEAEYQTVASKRRLQASSSLKEQFSDALDEFERITGFREEILMLSGIIDFRSTDHPAGIAVNLYEHRALSSADRA